MLPAEDHACHRCAVRLAGTTGTVFGTERRLLPDLGVGERRVAQVDRAVQHSYLNALVADRLLPQIG